MLTEWRLHQFKSVGQKERLRLGPLTIFTGANSSGKSTVLQSILVVAQTLASKVADRPLVLNGEYAKLGTFDDVLLDGADTLRIGIGFSLRLPHDFLRSTSVRSAGAFAPAFFYPIPDFAAAQFSTDLHFAPVNRSGKAESLQAELASAEFGIEFEGGTGQTMPAKTYKLTRRTDAEVGELVNSAGLSDPDGAGLAPITALRYGVQSTTPIDMHFSWFQGGIYDPKREVIAADLEHFLPVRLAQRFNLVSRDIAIALHRLEENGPQRAARMLQEWLGSQDRDEQCLARAFKELSDERTRDAHVGALLRNRKPNEFWERVVARAFEWATRTTSRQNAVELLPVPPDLALLRQMVVQYFAGTLRYLGPLRDDPKPLYALASSADPSNVGVKGEFTASVLNLYADKIVDFVPPDDLQAPARRIRLAEAVRAWVRYLDIADSFTTRDEGKLGHRLEIQPGGIRRAVDLTNVGVGVSQVLPIVVTALVSDPGAVILLEQPELHLHPKVQSRLADFFLAVMKSGRQCIIETHSEYLVNRLRLRIAEASIGSDLNKQIVLYFVERRPPVSCFREVEINEYGAIPQWPAGFFDQGPDEADRILAAGLRKRQFLARSKAV